MLNHFYGVYALDGAQTIPSNSALLPLTPRYQEYKSLDGRLALFATQIHWNDADASTPSAGDRGSAAIALAGDLIPRDGVMNGGKDLDAVLSVFRREGPNTLRIFDGTFATAVYSAETGLLLATDVLGARPLYYSRSGSLLFFSTSFHFLLKTSAIRQSLDLRALAEQYAFCYPLGARTLTTGVSVLRDAEYLVADRDSFTVNRYFDWASQRILPRNRQRELETAVAAIRQSVRSRSFGELHQAALLSGGLDSRCLVAILREQGRTVDTSNCSPPNTLDLQYAAAAAQALGVTLQLTPWSESLIAPTPGKTTAALLGRASGVLAASSVFSGDGGGETIGFLGFSDEVLHELENGQVEKAIRHHVAASQLSTKLLSVRIAAEMADYVVCGITEELEALNDLPRQKAFQLFLLRNDLRRHLHEYFDSTDEATKDLSLPFYDKRVLAAVVEIAPPFDQYVGHRFYYDLLPLLPKEVGQIPWQAYPKSLQCPLASVDEGLNQWRFAKSLKRGRASRQRSRAVQTVLSGRSPSLYLRSGALLTYALLDLLRFRDYSYVFEQYDSFVEVVRAYDRSADQ